MTADYVCRVLNHMGALGMRQCTPRLREQDKGMQTLPWINNFSAGYIQRSQHLFPQQGSHAPWKLYQNYLKDIMMLRYASLNDGVMAFS